MPDGQIKKWSLLKIENVERSEVLYVVSPMQLSQLEDLVAVLCVQLDLDPEKALIYAKSKKARGGRRKTVSRLMVGVGSDNFENILRIIGPLHTMALNELAKQELNKLRI